MTKKTTKSPPPLHHGQVFRPGQRQLQLAPVLRRKPHAAKAERRGVGESKVQATELLTLLHGLGAPRTTESQAFCRRLGWFLVCFTCFFFQNPLQIRRSLSHRLCGPIFRCPNTAHPTRSSVTSLKAISSCNSCNRMALWPYGARKLSFRRRSLEAVLHLS